ncbi:MAG: otopetrin domain-containing protein [Thaumarchaeota archaeon]|nr:otopetrin domain-containing protein [Nitrososphaerota archaeon]
MASMSSTAARVLVAGLGAITLAIGARVAYTSYISERILSQCISGGSCQLNLSGIDLQSAYSAARGQLFLGIGLVVFGIIAMIYSFLFAGSYSRITVAKE